MQGKQNAAHGAGDDTKEFAVQLEEEGFGAAQVDGEEPDIQVETGTGATGEDLKSQLEAALQEAAQAKDQSLRLAAEFENYKKRIERERANSLKFAEESILRDLLSTIDNLERATEQGRNTEDIASLIEGVEMTRNGLLATLERYGLKAVEGVGEPFDPNLHEALATGVSETLPANHVMQEYEKGYLYKDRLLRAAKVVVSKQDDNEAN